MSNSQLSALLPDLPDQFPSPIEFNSSHVHQEPKTLLPFDEVTPASPARPSPILIIQESKQIPIVPTESTQDKPRRRKKVDQKKTPDQVPIDELKAAYEKLENRRAQQHQYYLDRKQKIQTYDQLKQTIEQLQKLVVSQQQEIQQLRAQLQ